MSTVKDQDLLERVLPLYDTGMGIGKIATSLCSSNGRIRRLLNSHGVNTKARTPVCSLKAGEVHPYSLRDVIDEKGLTVVDVATRLGVNVQTVGRWRREGLPWQKADEVALALGNMPQDLWDHWFDFE